MIADLDTVLAWIDHIRELSDSLLQYSETLTGGQRQDVETIRTAALVYPQLYEYLAPVREYLNNLPPFQALHQESWLSAEWMTQLNTINGLLELLLMGSGGTIADAELQVLHEMYEYAQAVLNWSATGS